MAGDCKYMVTVRLKFYMCSTNRRSWPAQPVSRTFSQVRQSLMTGNSQRKLGNTQRLFQECSNIYRQVMRETPGSRDARRMAARQASAAHAGGGYTQKWSQLCDASIVISICATAPTADNQAVASGNGRRMLMVICQCDPALEGMWQGMWTSIKEIGTLSQTYIYVRYPSHMGEKLQKLCEVLQQIRVQNHRFSARVVTEGRGQASS